MNKVGCPPRHRGEVKQCISFLNHIIPALRQGLFFVGHNNNLFVSLSKMKKAYVMAKVSVTVNMDSRMKEQIDQFCAMSGNTQEQTFDEMMRMWERIVFVPWTEYSNKEKARRRMLDLLARQRERVASGEVKALSLDEINAEIAATRAERHAREARP